MMNDKHAVFHSSFRIHHSSLRLFVSRVPTAAAAELTEFEAFRRRLLVFRRHVVAVLALRALQHNVIARHVSPYFVFNFGFLIRDSS